MDGPRGTRRRPRRPGTEQRIADPQYKEDSALSQTGFMKRLTMAVVAMLVAVGTAGAATAAAQTQTDADFSGGTPDANVEVIPPGDLALAPDYRHLRGLRRDSAADGLGRGAVGRGRNRDRRWRDAHRRWGAGQPDGVLRRRPLARLRGHVHGRPVPACRLRQHVRRRPLGDVQHGRRGAARGALRPDLGAWRDAARTRRSPVSIRSSSTTTASNGRPPRSGTTWTAIWWRPTPSR